jgi:hypothetical protein
LQTEDKATWYRLDIPMSVHGSAAHADLRDLRVFNAEGEALPYALVPGRERVTQTRRVETARLFDLHTHAAIGEEPGLWIKRTEEGTHVEILPGKPAFRSNAISGWLLEVGEQDFPLERLRLDWGGDNANWPEDAASFQRFDIDASDDLENWHNWGEGQIAHVGFGEEYIDQREIVLPKQKARYLRLTWHTPQRIILKTAQVSGTRSGCEPAPLIWSEPIPGKQSGDDEFTWQLPRPLPLARVRISVQEANTLAPVVLSGSLGQEEAPQTQSGKLIVIPREKPAAADPWRTLARGVLYRLPENGREVTQEELELPEEAVRQLRLQLDPRGGGLGREVPELRVALHGYQLIFLSRGNPPYRLAFGREDATSAALPLTTLIPGYDERQPPAFGLARVTEDATISTISSAGPAPEQATINWKKTGLWAVLLLGVALLVGMAVSLLRAPGK